MEAQWGLQDGHWGRQVAAGNNLQSAIDNWHVISGLYQVIRMMSQWIALGDMNHESWIVVGGTGIEDCGL